MSNRNRVLITTTAICLLPLLMSAVVYSQLPPLINIHWDIFGNPDNALPKAFAAFGLPLLLSLINLYTIFRLYSDPKRDNHSPILRLISLSVTPILSVIIMPVTLFMAMGVDIPIIFITNLLVGVVLILVGNYLPKTRQNHTIGIKLPWTLEYPDIWNKTNRLAGYLYLNAGVLILLVNFIFPQGGYVAAVLTFILIVINMGTPALYSYILYRKRI